MRIHIIGICGIGMSAIAIILHKMGYKVQGSDCGANITMLNKMLFLGIEVMDSHSTSNISNADLIIKSTAIANDNIEIIAAKSQNKKIITRAESLAIILKDKDVIAISGAHGKSTTVALMYDIMQKALLSPSVICGAIINSIESNAKLGQSKFFIVEADESDGTFCTIPYYCGALTNIDYEHIAHYGDFDSLASHYKIFIQNVHRSGMIAICKDDEILSKITANTHNENYIVRNSIVANADIMATNIQLNGFKSNFDVEFAGKFNHIKPMRKVELNLPGQHNIYNALTAISIAVKLNISEKNIQYALKEFLGLQRRCSIIGNISGATIVDDYAHHPTEIMSSIKAMQPIGRVICIIQPHRFSRVKMLFNEYTKIAQYTYYTFFFNVYAAGEKLIPGCTSQDIVNENIANGTNNVELLEAKDMHQRILSILQNKDIVLFCGAGNITNFANEFFTNNKKM